MCVCVCVWVCVHSSWSHLTHLTGVTDTPGKLALGKEPGQELVTVSYRHRRNVFSSKPRRSRSNLLATRPIVLDYNLAESKNF